MEIQSVRGDWIVVLWCYANLQSIEPDGDMFLCSAAVPGLVGVGSSRVDAVSDVWWLCKARSSVLFTLRVCSSRLGAFPYCKS